MIPPDSKCSPRAERLREFCKSFEDADFTWGENDCTLWVALWLQQESGVELDLPEYRSESEARDIINSAGGLNFLWASALAENGIKEKYPPEVGDIGIVQFGESQIGCIFASGNIAVVRSEKRICYVRSGSAIQSWGTLNCHEK